MGLTRLLWPSDVEDFVCTRKHNQAREYTPQVVFDSYGSRRTCHADRQTSNL